MREPVPRPSSARSDRAAFEVLYRSTGSAVLGYALRRAATPDDAHDAVAETYTVAWRRRADTPVDPDEVRPWLFGIARRCLADIDRSAARATRLGAKLADAFVPGTIPDPAVGEDYAPVRAAMAGLPDADRELVSLVAWEGLTPSQAAVALGLSPAATRVRLHRARARLKHALSISVVQPATDLEEADHDR
jgi:RNA polymerase sigma factor (sigma-70 family)